MPVTEVISDAQSLTMSILAEYPVAVSRLWDAYADPRQLERFWGPPQWPATFTRHDMSVGGYSHYYMTGPDGTKSHGWFRFLSIAPQQRIEVEEGFADENGQPNTEMPASHMSFAFVATPAGSQLRTVTTFSSIEAMEQLLQMGMLEGLKAAMGQIDDVLADLASFSATLATEAQLLSDTQVRIARVVRGTPTQLWRAHHESALLQRWLLGPDGWTMPVCRVATHVGESYRYEWASADGAQRFGFEGELLESSAPHRAVTTERMMDTEGPSTRNELTFVPVQGGTLLSLVITYPSKELRDMILATGMTTGMETSYARLEAQLAAA